MLVDIDNIRLFEGIITEVTDVSVSVDLAGRMGMMRVPLRMVITDKKLEVGQKVSINMSYIEVI
ncbi:hypothetical protein SCHIN_v1c02010 [Spiroplasma chinense]|uniref:S1 motif domain-containing protein n=1 Tax=Spiroplasma chinense TaxID=216932 RepID=A0A5B9Y3Z7_9MOLU|nr:CBO2463/CBO2479 domain-containing protein [Spiroplasma chinense]QEH61399.1 hypothetical protein SCHIN_v1c02010 [Spiroplasma chinense]